MYNAILKAGPYNIVHMFVLSCCLNCCTLKLIELKIGCKQPQPWMLSYLGTEYKIFPARFGSTSIVEVRCKKNTSYIVNAS